MWKAVWQGSLMLAAIWLICLTVPNVPGRVRCWLWRLAFAKLIVCLFWSKAVDLPVLSSVKPVAVIAPFHSSQPTFFHPSKPNISIVNTSPVMLNWSGLLLVVWVAIVLTGLMAITRQWWRVRRLVLASSPLNDQQVETTLVSLCAEYGLRAPPTILTTPGLASPLLAGMIRPVILAPKCFLHDKSPAQWRMMLGHELAHIQRHDLAWNWLAVAARLLFFFHPLVWLAARENRLAGEMAADELTLSVCQVKRVDYAGMLVEVAAAFLSPQTETFVVGVVGSHQTLKRRLQAMKNIRSMSNRQLSAAALIVALVCAATIVPWRAVAKDSRPQQKPATEIRVDAEGRYHYGGRVVALEQLASDLKTVVAANPSLSLSIQAEAKVPVRYLTALLDKLDEAGVSRVSLGNSATVSLEPQILDIAFGVWKPEESKQTGPAAAGHEGDYWNTPAVAWNNDHTESGLKFASHDSSPVQIRMVNLAGGWGNDDHMGVKAPMFNSYNYPVNNQGGNSQVILKQVPPGKYDLYIYGHENFPVAYGDYTVTVGGRAYGRKTTSNKSDALENTSWVEDSQYVKFSGVEIGPGADLGILIQPGGQVTDHWGRTFSDAVINGLQLVPAQ